MVERRRVAQFIVHWGCVGLLLAAAGCQLQVAFVDNATKPSAAAGKPAAQPASTGASAEVIQTSYQTLPPATLPPAPGMPQVGIPMDAGGMVMPGPATLPAPGAVVGGPVGPGPTAVDPTCQGNSCSPGNVPTEKQKTSLPPYLIEPPDILLLDPIRMIPKPPYLVQPLDALLIRVAEPLPNQPIDGTYTVTPDGTVNLGYSYGQIRVAGYTLEDVERVIRNHLGRVLKDPQIAVGLAQFRGVQQTRGEHLVRMDGTISLGSYGCVYVAGLTLAQAKVAIERHLSQYLLDPEVSVDVFAYNSKSYYVITDGAGYGQQVYRFPVTGNETVLDAISQIQGLPAVASKKKIWLARPAPACHGCSQILPIDWRAITEGGVTATNYQIFPGDRIYVHSDWLICLDNTLNKVLSPIQQVLFTTIFFGAAVNQFKSGGGNNNAGTILAAPVR